MGLSRKSLTLRLFNINTKTYLFKVFNDYKLLREICRGER